jgi:hypothetical protein
MQIYSPNEKSSTTKLFIAIVSLVVILFFLAFGHSLVLAYTLSFPVFVFLMTATYVLLIGISINTICYTFKIALRKQRDGLAHLGVFLGIYFSIAANMVFHYSEDSPVSDYFIKLYPIQKADEICKSFMVMLVEWSSLGNTIIFYVYLFVLIIVIYSIVKSLVRKIVPPPLSPKNQWYKPYKLYPKFEKLAITDTFFSKLEKSPVTALRRLDKKRYRNYAEVYVYFLEKEKKQYVSIVNIISNTEGKKRTSIVKYMEVSKEQALCLMNEYHYQESFILNQFF